MEQNNRMVTVTITEDGKEIANIADNNLFIVSNDRAFTSLSCTLSNLLAFAVKIQAYFFKNLMTPLMKETKIGVTEEMLLNNILNIAKSVVSGLESCEEELN